jgi:N-hydroxyarylamine O-acetyltransferase
MGVPRACGTMAVMTPEIDLGAYFARTGCPAPVRADLAVLKMLCRAHVAAIPFENLDIQMGLPINLDPESLQASLVGRRRGGYCFQQNGLFRLVLTALGFEPRACEGRVRLDAGETIRPRTHMVLLVPLDGRLWLTDVGFGANGLVEPVALGADPVRQDGWTYRTAPYGRGHVLQRAGRNAWEDLYVFWEDEVPHIDYVTGNWYTSTHPDSGFVRSLTVQRIVDGRRHIIRNLTHLVLQDGDWQARELRREELVPLLRHTFGLDLPDDAQFLAIDGPRGPVRPA